MKGVVLAGGTGSRLFPLTKITNKHLLPIYDKPMIYYPIQTLVDAGIRDILIVTGGRNAGDFLRLLANGKEFGLTHLDFTYQEGEGGIAEALSLAEHFADGERICVVLGDNIIAGSIKEAVDAFRTQPGGARILLKEVEDAERFGVAEIVGDKIIGAPTTDVRYTVSITDKDGNAVAFQANNGPRNPSAPIDLIGTFEVVESGSYKFDIKASDGSATPAAIMIGSVTQEEAAALADSGIALLKGLGGGCVFGCGALMLVGFGIPALIVRSRSKKAPPDVLDVA